jgi:hypothetical protein
MSEAINQKAPASKPEAIRPHWMKEAPRSDAKKPEVATGTKPAAVPRQFEPHSDAELTALLNEKQLLARLPISRRTLGNWKTKGWLPFIKIGRRCLYDWPNVHAALLRQQRNGGESS